MSNTHKGERNTLLTHLSQLKKGRTKCVLNAMASKHKQIIP